VQLGVVVEDIGQIEDLELAHAERPELGERRGEHLHRPELQRLHLLAVFEQRAVGVNLDLDAALGPLLGEFLEVLGALALGGVDGHHVAELDDDGLLRRCDADHGEQGPGGNEEREARCHRTLQVMSIAKTCRLTPRPTYPSGE
jgi:hypothetical protein